MDEAETLLALFGDEDDLDLDALNAVAEATREGRPLGDDEIESLLRAEWGLPAVDVSSAMGDVARGRSIHTDEGDADDFTDEEWIIVQAMHAKCQDAIRAKTPDKRLAAAVEWLFVRGTEDRKGVSFHLACAALKSRPWVIQALVQHFWFLRGVTLPQGLPFMADPLPEALQSEAILRGWEAGMMLMATAWRKPAILIPDLRRECERVGDDFDRALEALLEAGLLGNRMGGIHVISRPATFRRSGSGISWSRSFLGDD